MKKYVVVFRQNDTNVLSHHFGLREKPQKSTKQSNRKSLFVTKIDKMMFFPTSKRQRQTRQDTFAPYKLTKPEIYVA